MFQNLQGNTLPQLLQALLELASSEPIVLVMVVDDQENVLDMEFQPMAAAAALFRLHNRPLPAQPTNPME